MHGCPQYEDTDSFLKSVGLLIKQKKEMLC